jgi:glutamine amidotransferase
VLPESVRPTRSDYRSDTRIAAEDYLPKFGSLHLRRNRQRLERWMTVHNKMVILTVDRRFRERAYILNEAAGIWDGGIWYSNDAYLPIPDPDWPTHDAGTWPWPWWEPDGDPLEHCQVFRDGIGDLDGECPRCGWCLDCGERPGDCYCYTPPTPRESGNRSALNPPRTPALRPVQSPPRPGS